MRARDHARTLLALAALVLPWMGCDGGEAEVDLTKPIHVDLASPMPARLSAFNFFAWDPATATFTYHDGIVPYDLNIALFSDYARKDRAIYVPPGSSATFEPELAFDFPVGTVILKSFSFAADLRKPNENVRLVETRLLVRFESGWQGFPYIWNEAQTDAVLSPAGEVRAIPFVDAEGSRVTANYLIPQRSQCASCHARKPDLASDAEITLLGVKARYLDRMRDYGGTLGLENQLSHLADAGVLSGLPSLDGITPAYDFRSVESGGVGGIPSTDIDVAARDYLDVNCAHCHNPLGLNGISSQLFLNHDDTDPQHLGVCKRPGSAGSGTGGFEFDIVPGDPDHSILVYRTETTDVGAMMPLLGRSITHRRGVELLRAWIAAMPAQTCK